MIRPRHSLAYLLALLVLFSLLPSSPADAAECFWEVGNAISGLDSEVVDIAVRSHNGILEIYAAGPFAYADGQRANGVAMWDGRRWMPLGGPNGVGIDGKIFGLEVFDAGGGPEVYVAGQFDTAGGVTVYNVARWTGTQWAPVGDPPGTGDDYAWIETLEVLDDGGGPALYASGFFDSMGGIEAHGMAKWNGSHWSAPGDGFLATALAMRDGDTGRRMVAGSNHAVREFDGQEWIPLGDLTEFDNHSVHALTLWDDGSGEALYAAGRHFGTFPGGYVSFWDGSDWTELPELGAAFDFAEIFALEPVVIDGESLLVAAGSFRYFEDEYLGYAAAWDGNSWRALEGSGGRGVNRRASTLEFVEEDGNPYLLVGGAFTLAGTEPASRLAKWDGQSWSTLESPLATGNGLNDVVFDYATWDDGTGEALYAAGSFDVASGRRVNNVARWNGRSWEPLAGPAGIGTDGYVYNLEIFDDGSGSALYAGGSFDTAGGVVANNIARWDGSSWSPLADDGGNGLDDAVIAMTVWDDGEGPDLYVGGYFQFAGGIESRTVARWDATAWSALDEPNGPRYGVVRDLQSFDDGTGDALYAVGWFGRSSQDGGPYLDSTAKFDGTTWSTLYRGGALPSWVETLEVWDDGDGPDLYAAGEGRDLGRLAGHFWEEASVTDFPDFRWLQGWDDGTGSKLYAGGRNLKWIPGIEDDDYLARWDGAEWSHFSGAPGSQPNGTVETLFPWQHDGVSTLLVGGWFTSVDGLPSAYSARWTCGSGSRCASDPDQSLCLSQLDRFVVDVTWRDFDGGEGRGRVVPFQTGDSGLFYFFDSDNWELLVKVLDACSFNDHFWVFSAATTNVEYALTVTDVVTGTTKSYFNPLGVAAPSVTDTEAFATCDAGATSASTGSAASAASALPSSPAQVGLSTARTSGPVGEKADCATSDTVLCLKDGRFALEIDWRDFEGDAGPGYVVEGTPSSDSGLFQFFGEDNWEVLVKVLDACGFNDRFWVFSAATTNVEYTLRVTDTETGETVSYFNPLGNAADAVTDTDAFATCR